MSKDWVITPHIPARVGSAIDREQRPGPEFRWTAKRKALLLAAVDEGLLTMGFVMAIYGISEEELLSWRAKIVAGGRKR